MPVFFLQILNLLRTNVLRNLDFLRRQNLQFFRANFLRNLNTA